MFLVRFTSLNYQLSPIYPSGMVQRQQNHYQNRRGAKAYGFQKLRDVKKTGFLDREENRTTPVVEGGKLNFFPYFASHGLSFLAWVKFPR